LINRGSNLFVDLEMTLELALPAVSFVVQRGEKMAKEKGYQLETYVC